MAAEAFAGWERARGARGAGLPAGLRGRHQRRAARRQRQRAAPGAGRSDGPPLPFDESWDVPGFEDEIAGEKEFTLRLRRGGESVWVEVFDQDLRLPRIRSAGENDEGGRGLYLVDQLAERWGSRPTKEGKAVWFEIPTKSR